MQFVNAVGFTGVGQQAGLWTLPDVDYSPLKCQTAPGRAVHRARAAGLGSKQVLINALADSDEGLADLVKRVASRNDSQDGTAFFYPRALGREVRR